MLRGTDFILNPMKLEEEFQLVEISEWSDFHTKERLGFYYTILLPKLKFEKLKVGIRGTHPLITNDELEEKGQITVRFEGFRTWGSLYQNRLSAKAEATTIKKVGVKP